MNGVSLANQIIKHTFEKGGRIEQAEMVKFLDENAIKEINHNTKALLCKYGRFTENVRNGFPLTGSSSEDYLRSALLYELNGDGVELAKILRPLK
ncbi:hypothetical protein Barb4_00846 [Bacteroidales bacterium Barb4]|nr:hypothetical protein Barb4_00846 [Bacteroidales bacterium Barb4]